MEVLVIMAKYPEPGQVKTRLAAAVGDARACELYTAFLRDISIRLTDEQRSVVWAMAPSGARLDDHLHPPPRQYIDQSGDGLAERMYNAFSFAFGAGASRVVMIGGDTPQLSREDIDGCFDSLTGCDVCLVPSSDGGYCAIGMRAAHDLFTPIRMSTARVLAETRALCRRRRLSVYESTELFDVDDLDDVRRLAAELPPAPALAATRRVLEAWAAADIL